MPRKTKTRKMTKREFATVLFALRFLQSNLSADEEVAEMYKTSETLEGEGLNPLTEAQIGLLCERLNFGEITLI